MERNTDDQISARSTMMLSRLPAVARRLAEASISANTRRAYAGALQRLASWLQGRVLDDESLGAYLADCHDAGLSPASISLIVAAVRFEWKFSGGAPSPVGPITGRLLAGIRREGRKRGRGQVTGLRWRQADLVSAVASNGGHSLAGLRDAALIAVMSDALLRVSELAALRVADIEAEEDGTGRLRIRESKTDREAKGAVLYLRRCTLWLINEWIAGAGISEGPLFRRVRRGGKTVGDYNLTPNSIRLIIQRRAKEAGLKGRFSGHSLRIGAAQSLAKAGAGLVDMQTAGRWTSPAMPGHYVRTQLAARGAVARLRPDEDRPWM